MADGGSCVNQIENTGLADGTSTGTGVSYRTVRAAYDPYLDLGGCGLLWDIGSAAGRAHRSVLRASKTNLTGEIRTPPASTTAAEVSSSEALKYIVIGGIAVAVFFAVAAAFMPTFAEEGATVATVVLGFFGSMGAAILVASGGQVAYKRAQRDQKESENNGGERDAE